MPTRAPRPCSVPGCGELVEDGLPRCPQHRVRKRPNREARGYDATWYRLRDRFLKTHPLCECGMVATDVDHIQSIRTHPELRLAWGNLRAMCHSCHARRTAADQPGGWNQPR